MACLSPTRDCHRPLAPLCPLGKNYQLGVCCVCPTLIITSGAFPGAMSLSPCVACAVPEDSRKHRFRLDGEQRGVRVFSLTPSKEALIVVTARSRCGPVWRLFVTLLRPGLCDEHGVESDTSSDTEDGVFPEIPRLKPPAGNEI